MKNKTKKFMALAMGAVLAGSVMVSPVKAASSVSGSLQGYTCRGTVSYNSTSATAATSWGHEGGVRTATATAYYYITASELAHSQATRTAISGGIPATATRPAGSTFTVVGGRGQHKVTYVSGSYNLSWGPLGTSIGTVN